MHVIGKNTAVYARFWKKTAKVICTRRRKKIIIVEKCPE
jgi:hypothetical protein